MAVKYECPKCSRRYVEWGADRLQYRCPNCSETGAPVTLLRVGSKEEMELTSASLRRRPKKEAVAVAVPDDIDDVVDDEEVDDEEVAEDEEVEVVEPVVIGEDHVVVPDEEVVDEDADEDAGDEEAPEDLDFGTEKADFDEGPAPEFDD